MKPNALAQPNAAILGARDSSRFTHCRSTGSGLNAHGLSFRALKLAGLSLFVAVSWYHAACLGQTPSLADAVDAPAYAWTGAGDVPWAGQTAVTQDGVDAARSGAIGNSQRSILRTSVVGPGTVGFWWKVSAGYGDYMEFDRSGGYQAEISGETGWEQRAFAIFAGTNVLEWIYSKDASGTGGSDAAWVDQVVVITNTTTWPTVVLQPADRTVNADVSTSMQVEVLGSTPIQYQWRCNGTNLPGKTSRYLSLTAVQPNQSGLYSVAVTNAAGWTISSNAALLVLPSLGGALDTTGLTWNVSSAGWFAQTTNTHDGVDAAQSGPIIGSGQASLRTTVTGPGTVAFWWKVSSRVNSNPLSTGDGLLFQTKDAQTLVSGEVGMERRAFPIASGAQTLEWIYYKSASPGLGLDAGWLDQVVVVTNSGVAPDIVRQPQPASVVSGEPGTMTVEVLGSAPITYQWRLNGAALVNETNRSLTVTNVSLATAGAYSVAVTNASGWAVSSNANFLVCPNLAEAVDAATNIVISSGSYWGPAYAWFGQTGVGANNEDAAQSRPLPEGCSASMLTASFQGPARISFWWKNTSVAHDLGLSTNNVWIIGLGAPNVWTEQTFDLGGSNCVVEWYYTPRSGMEGTNETGVAWVDQVRVIQYVGPPQIATQPLSLRAAPGIDVDFSVEASGQLPLRYQWRFNGTPLTGETNATLLRTNVSPGLAGTYSVSVSNALGGVVSSNALLTLAQPSGDPFKIALLTPANLQTLAHGVQTGWAPGGMAASGSRLFYTANDATLRFNLGDLSGATTLTQRFSALVNDFRDGKTYCLANGYGPVGPLNGGGVRPITHFLELDGTTGELTTNRVRLSTTVSMDLGAAVFAGYGRILLLPLTGCSGAYEIHRAFEIALPSGQVLDLGDVWCFIGELGGSWGVCEFDGQQLSLVYGAPYGLRRMPLPGPTAQSLVTFPTLYSVDSLTLSLSLNRFYFEGQSESQAGPRVVGYGEFLYKPWFTGPPTADGADRLRYDLRSPQGHDVGVEVSTNLTAWTAFTNLANPTGALQFTAPATGLPHRFYRARTQ